MLRLRRIIAVLLMVLFAPSALLAAAPLILCIASNGTQAVESIFVDGDLHHQLAVSENHDHSGPVSVDCFNDCIDLTLVADHLGARRDHEIGTSHAPVPLVLVPSQQYPTLDAVSRLSYVAVKHATPQLKRPNPRLVALSSVVLRN